MNTVAILAGASVVLGAAAGAGVVALLLYFGRNLRVLREKMSAFEAVPQKWGELGEVMNAMEGRIADLEEGRTPPAEWFSEAGPVNLNRRGQVLRLHRRGESAGQIASVLGLSQGEVKLIVKVHDLGRAGVEAEKCEARTLNPRKIIDRGYTGPPMGGK